MFRDKTLQTPIFSDKTRKRLKLRPARDAKPRTMILFAGGKSS